jgi:hypothetical protein
MIIDCHGHGTTAPTALQTCRNSRIAGLELTAAKPPHRI